MLQAKKYTAQLSLLTLLISLSAPSVFAADANAGADSFDSNCADCHSVAKPAKNKKGPSLLGIVGRTSASVAGYNYSDAMRAANLTWTSEKLDAYITNPKVVVPNDKMKFKGMPSAEERANLIEFLLNQQ